MSPSSSATSTMQLSFLTRGTGSVWGISQPFGWLSPAQRQITHVLLTRSPLYYSEESLVRLACVRRAASVRSEPGSNSQNYTSFTRATTSTHFFFAVWFGYAIVKERLNSELEIVLERTGIVKAISEECTFQVNFFVTGRLHRLITASRFHPTIASAVRAHEAD